MPRLTRSLLLGAALIAIAAARPPAGASALDDCVGFSPGARVSVESVDLILVARIEAGTEAGQVVIRPEAYLKGSAERQAFSLRHPAPGSSQQQLATWECPPAALDPGTTALLALSNDGSRLAWPDAWHVFLIEDGLATSGGDPSIALPEDELIEQIRSVTGQYVVPAEGEGTFSIQGSNIAILVVALVAVFGIGLALMRVWHRIDPS